MRMKRGDPARGSSPLRSRNVPIPDSPSLSVLLPSSPPLSVLLPPNASSLSKDWVPSKAPRATHENYDHASDVQLHDLYAHRGYSRKDSKAVLKARSASMDEENPKRTIVEDDAIGTSETLTGKKDRAPGAVAENSDLSPGNQEKRCRVGALHFASVAGKEVVREHAQWRNSDLKSRWAAAHASAVDGVDAAVSARIAQDRNRV